MKQTELDMSVFSNGSRHNQFIILCMPAQSPEVKEFEMHFRVLISAGARYYIALCGSALLVLAAQAADVSPKDINWNGPYVGGYIGLGSIGTTQIDGPDELEFSYSGSNVIGGVQLGYDHQVGQYVVGIRALLDFSRLKASTLYPGWSAEQSAEVDHLGSVMASVGYLIRPQILLYLNSGVTWARFNYRDGLSQETEGYLYSGTASAQGVGWSVGGGLEYAISTNLSAFAEFTQVNFPGMTSTLIYTGPNPFVPEYEYGYENTLGRASFGFKYRF